MRKGHQRVFVSLISMALLGGCASTSKFEGLAAVDLFDLAASEFEQEEWDNATEAFQRLIFAEPTFERLVEARMYLARAYYNKGEFITAVSEFTRVLDRHPGHELAPQASLGICQSYVAQSPHVQRDQTATGQAWSACQNTLTDFRGTDVASTAESLRDQMEEKLAEKVFANGDFYFRRKLYHSGIIYFNEVLNQYPGNRWAAHALLRLHQSYSLLDWDTEAEEARERLLREYPDSDAAREIGADGSGGGGGGKETA